MNIRYISYEQAKILAGPWAKQVNHNPNAKYIGAFIQKTLIGAVGILIQGQNIKYCSDIVLPDFRKRGIYTLLFQAREMEAAKIPHEKTIAYCTDYSLRMYLSRGFIITRKYKQSTKVERYELQRRNTASQRASRR